MSERVREWVVVGLIAGLLGFVSWQVVGSASPPEDRATQLQQRLRCPTCRSVSIAESPSPTAATMRRIVESQVAAGRSDQEVVAYFRQRYGPWVLLDPPRSGRTLPLWLLPALALAVGGAVLLRLRGSGRDVPGELSATERDAVGLALASYRRAEQEP